MPTPAPTVPYSDAALVAELQNDPVHMGYAPLLNAAQGPQEALLVALINSDASPGSGTVKGDPVSGTDLVALLDPTELNALSSANFDQINLLLRLPVVPIGDPKFQSWLTGIWSAGNCPNSNSVIVAKSTRTGSRAEVLWGTGVDISDAQMLAAIHTIKGT